MEIWSSNYGNIENKMHWSKVRLIWYEHSQMAIFIHSSYLLSIVIDTNFLNTNNPMSGCPSGRQSSSTVLSGSTCARHGLLTAQLFPSCRKTSTPLLLTRDKSIYVSLFWLWNSERSFFLFFFFFKIVLRRQYVNYNRIAVKDGIKPIKLYKGNR